jgi:hypothetical protein
MNTKQIIPTIAAVALGLTAQATTYNGNGNTSFNGAIGNGSLTLTDNGTTVSGSLTTGAGLSGNAFVLYIEAGLTPAGFSTTSGFNDNGDQLRTAISQYNGAGNQSILNFASGFTPNYAIAMQPASGINFGGMWQLTAGGGANSLPFDTSVSLSPTGSDAAGTYTFSFNLSSIGLTGGQSFELFGMQISTTGYSSAEAIGGGLTGSLGYGGTQTETSFSTYTTTAVPEPTTLALAGLGGLATLVAARRRK